MYNKVELCGVDTAGLPVLSEEEKRALLIAAHAGDKAARRRMIEGNLMIVGEIRRFLRDNNAVRVSRSMRDTAYRAMQAREQLEKSLGREPTLAETSDAVGLSRREVAAALASVVEPVSLEEPVYSDGGDAVYMMDQVRDTDGEDSWISALEFRQTVQDLPERERRIVELRYLLGKTQMEVAREIGISQAQVSRLEKSALQQFRR